MEWFSWLSNPGTQMPAWLAFEPFSWGVSMLRMFTAFALWGASWLALSGLRSLVVLRLRRLEARETDTRRSALDVMIEFFGTLPSGLLAVLALYLPLASLASGTRIMPGVHAALLAIIVVYGVRLGLALFERFARASLVERQERRRADETTYSIVMITVRGVVFVIAALFVLSNFGVEITPVLASLGIGGIAVAFALQNILADIFASVSIYFDRPFQIGDLVSLGADTGYVRKIGLKSTRLRALDGQELVISNKEIANTRINNFSSLERRRVVFAFSVARETPHEQLAALPELVSACFADVKQSSFSRAHLVGVKAASYDFEAVYHVQSGDPKVFMDARQTFLLAFADMLARESISLA
jgi:small-conductance mechanosensitive channel